MTEEKVGLLCGLAASISTENRSHKILRSYYLMRCNELTHGYGLPMKQFSRSARCPKCCLEWTRDTIVNVKSMRTNKKNTKRHNQKKTDTLNEVSSKNKLSQNEMEQICQFCKSCSKTVLVKPEKEYIKATPQKVINGLAKDNEIERINMKDKTSKKLTDVNKKELNNAKVQQKQNSVVNLYTNAFDVFSLKNEKNTLTSSVKAPTKVIKNNKKKKDKFAGLCQKAVLATKHQMETQQQTIQNKLNLFLKPSSN